MIRKLSCSIVTFFFLFSLTIAGYADQLTQHIEYLSSLKSRIPGYPGHEKAASYIENFLKSLGLKVKKEEVEVTVPVSRGGELTIKDKTFPIYPLWPNLVRTPTVPPQGIKGEVIYAGKGNYEDITGEKIKDNILILDFNSGNAWIDMAMLGAKAIVFVEPENTSRYEAEKKFLSQPLNIPRYWLPRKYFSGLLSILSNKKAEGTLRGRMDWENVKSYNIYATLEGSDPKLKDQLIILSTFYDSISVVPDFAPGATSAFNTAALLNIAQEFVNSPPRRSIMFLFTTGHYENISGITAFTQRHLRKHRFIRSKIKEPIDANLFIALDLSPGNDEIGVWHGTDDFYYQKVFAPFGKKFEKYNKEVSKALGYNPENTLTNGISPVKGISWDTLVFEKIMVEGTPVLYSGTPALNFVTIYDSRNYLDTPFDTLDKYNPAFIQKQSRFLSRLLREALNDSNLFPSFQTQLKDKLRSLEARLVTFNPRTSFVPSNPVSGAIAYLHLTSQEKTYMGVRGLKLKMTNKDGRALFNAVNNIALKKTPGYYLEGYALNPNTGEIILAPDLGVNGNENYPLQLKMTNVENDHMIVLFPCKPINVFDLIDPAFLVSLDRIDVFDRANSTPYAYGESRFVPREWTWTSDSEPVGVVFAQSQSWVKILGSSGPLGKRYLLLNSQNWKTKEGSEGIGFNPEQTSSIIRTPYQGAHDMLYLDDFRIKNLIKYGISNRRLENLHKWAWESFKKAEEALKNRLWDRFMKFSRQALAVESRAYPDVKATSNDVIKGIIFYLAILLPFAYFAERLFFGFPDIKKQLGGVFGIFLFIYWIMRMVHPAFRLANTPEVILLSFILLSLSVIVVSIISSKFEEQMQEMKRERAKVHEADVGRISATAAAFTLGVSNMKRRKVRTWLTSITLILLTFTVLSFTSVKTFMKYNRVLRDNKPLYQGILVRDKSWNPFEEVVLEHLRSVFFNEARVIPRSWLISPILEATTFIKLRHDNQAAYASGLVGVVPQEDQITHISRFLIAGRWFRKGEKNVIILPQRLASLLKINKEEVGKTYLMLLGEKVKVIGILNDEAMKNLHDLDDERITPVNFSMMDSKKIERVKQEKVVMAGIGKTNIETFTHSEYSTVPFLPYDFVMENGGTLQSMVLSFPKGTNIIAQAEKFVSRLGLTIFTGVGDRVWVYSSVGLTSYRGMGNLAVPILIAALIVLNTMLGSVYERIKEISTYSSVGLAPVHIAALFIAEAAVYAVLGAVAGYLLGQVVAKLATTFGFLTGLTLNYSSLSAVTSTLIVMAVVMLSTLYPARKASQLSVPDVTRRWVLPEPKGDVWEFDFPFTISGKEILGVYIFFRNYFSAYTEESVGTFFTQGVEFKTFDWKGETGYSMEMVVHLAPFDLGVSQHATLKAIPTGEFGVYLIKVILKRRSGEIGAWKRVNRRFLDTLRKQFLVWRTLSPKIKSEYHEEGESLLREKE
ncbi:MAG: FtsX-like permease family protein [Caldiserica bacterium]|nr:FtsX-like permease family protein [Caldisericota bacterium]